MEHVLTREFAYRGGDFERARRMLYARAGIALGDAKRELVYGRLARRTRILALRSIGEYLDLAETDTAEAEHFTNALTTNLTSFFREPHHFELLAAHVRGRRGRTLRVWCGAASTGEEPWSLALTLAAEDVPFEIIATDVDTEVLARAAEGVYADDDVADVPARCRKFLERGSGVNAGRVRVAKALRPHVRFRRLNLIESAWPLQGPFDVVFLRNVLIYFDRATKGPVVARALDLLRPGGIFATGHAESLFAHAGRVVPIGHTIYRRT